MKYFMAPICLPQASHRKTLGLLGRKPRSPANGFATRGKKAWGKWRYGIAALFLLFAAPAFAACPVKAPPGMVSEGTLTIGTMLSNPPQMFSEGGQPSGVEIDLSRAIAAKMCLKAEFVNVTFAGLFPGLMARKFDYVSSGLGITPERQKTFDFVPYFLGGIQLVARTDSHLFFK